MNFQPNNILIIDFGQIGDVLLSLPALKSVRNKFTNAKITVMIGKTGADIIDLTDFVDEKIVIDRVKLLKSNKFWSISQIFKIVRDVRRRKFDFIIDLHSLYETNLLGFLAGAKYRLYANRENRSLDSLANFQPKPPPEDKTKHLTERYLDVLKPLGIENPEKFVEIAPRQSDLETVGKIFRENNISEKKMIGFFPGAGNPSRRWKLENFAETAKNLIEINNLHTIVFLGPEEKKLRGEVEKLFPPETFIIDKLSLLEFTAALSYLEILVSNDTSAVHIGAVAGTSIVLVMDRRAPTTYLPSTDKLRIVNSQILDNIPVNDVLQAVKALLVTEKNRR